MLKFEVSGQRYEVDLDPAKLMGDEFLLIDELLPAGFEQRWANYEFGVRDILVLTHLAAKRAGDQRPFGEFAKTVAPLTFRPVVDGKPVRPRAAAKTAPPEDALGPLVRGRKPKAKAEEPAEAGEEDRGQEL